MSRRYPIEKAFESDPAPWPWYTEKAAAKRLGVDRTFLNGLANNPIRSCRRLGKTGNTVVLFNRDDIDALAKKMRSR